MRFCFIDFETTGVNVLDELLTAYLIVADNELKIEHEEFFSFRPTCSKDRWSKEAEKIHGIAYETAMTFPDAEIGLQKLVESIPKHSTLVCHARYNGSYFDVATFKGALFVLDDDNLYYRFLGKYTNQLSTHTMYNNLVKKGYLPSVKGYTLDNICKQLGVELGRHHDAQCDTRACYEVFRILKGIEETGSVRTLPGND